MQNLMTFRQVQRTVEQFPLIDKVRLVEWIFPQIKQELENTSFIPRKSLRGLCADLGPAPSADEIDQIRREEWAGFPREDI